MRILVLGGTGAMGVSVVNKLAACGDEVVVTSRSNIESKFDNVRYMVGNAHDEKFIKNLSSCGFDAVIDFMHYSSEEFKQKINLLLEMSEHYLFLSSCRVFADCNYAINENSDRLVDVINDSAFLKSDDYAIAKARDEDELYKQTCKNWTILRPYITYNINRLELGMISKENWLYRSLHGRSIVLPKEMLEKRTVLTSSDDVGEIIVTIVHKRLAVGESVNVTNASAITWGQALNVYRKAINLIMGFMPSVTLVDDVEQYSESVKCYYKYKYDRAYNREFDNRKLVSLIGKYTFVDYIDGLEYCLKEFLKNPLFKGIDWRVEGELDKFSREKTRIQEISGLKDKIKYLSHRYSNLEI